MAEDKRGGMGMAQRPDGDTVAAQFRRQVAYLVAASDRKGIKAVFVELAVAAAMAEGHEGLSQMTEELRQALLAPQRRVRRHLFDDF